MKIIYSTDQNYVRHCATSICSLLENNISEKNIEIIIITNQVSKKSKNKIVNLINKYKRKITFIEMQDLCDDFQTKNRFPVSAFARLFLENIPDIDKILYIDCDTIIKGSISELWNIDLKDYYLAGVEDTIQPYAKKILGLSKNDRYLNSGVLLINLKKWRQENIKQQFLNFMKNKNWNVPHNDQGVLNGVLKGKILFISPKFNMMPELLIMNNKQLKKLYNMEKYYTDKILEDAQKNIVIIHYLTKFFNRPWYKSCTHPLKQEYIKYLKITGFENNLLNGDLKLGIKFQKLLFEKTNFNFYLLVQKILNFRRKIIWIIKDSNKN